MNNRRDFLKIGCGTALAGLLGQNCLANNQTNDKSVIWIQLMGGASHIEFTHPIPDAPIEYRSILGHQQTNINGIRLSNLWDKLAKNTDKLAIMGAMSHTNAGHSGGTAWMVTGLDNRNIDNDGRPNNPSIGSIVAKYHGANNSKGIPNYISNTRIASDGAAWLGASYSPFENSGQAKKNLTLNIDSSRFNERRTLLNAFDNVSDAFREQSYNILGGSIEQVFDTKAEPDHIKKKYLNNNFGNNLLMARRLAENQSKFIMVGHGNWDFHGQIKKFSKQAIPTTDQSIAALIEDIYQRGLQSKILVVITTEFGRTSRLNNGQPNGPGYSEPGRDHQSGIVPCVLSGGIKTGQYIGAANSKAEYPVSGKYTPQHLMGSIFKFLDIPLDYTVTDATGRPVYLLKDQDYIKEIS